MADSGGSIMSLGVETGRKLVKHEYTLLDNEHSSPVVEAIFDPRPAVRTLGEGDRGFPSVDLALYSRRFRIAQLRYIVCQ